MKIGYARVSKDEQNPELQMEALKRAGCEKIYVDEGVSGRKTSRPELDKMLPTLEVGDELVIWKLDRLGRDALHLITLAAELSRDGIKLVSLTESLETETPGGEFNFFIRAAQTQYESRLTGERTKAGLAVAKAKGIKLGPKFKYSEEDIVKGKVPKSTYYRRRA